MWMMSPPVLAPTVTHSPWPTAALAPQPVSACSQVVPHQRFTARSTSPPAPVRAEPVTALTARARSPRASVHLVGGSPPPQRLSGQSLGAPATSGALGLRPIGSPANLIPSQRSPGPVRPGAAGSLTAPCFAFGRTSAEDLQGSRATQSVLRSPQRSVHSVPRRSATSQCVSQQPPEVALTARQTTDGGAMPRLLLDHRTPLADLAAANSSEYSPRDSVWKRYFGGGESPPPRQVEEGSKPIVRTSAHGSGSSLQNVAPKAVQHAPVTIGETAEASPFGCSPRGALGSQASTWDGYTSRTEPGSLADSWQAVPCGASNVRHTENAAQLNRRVAEEASAHERSLLGSGSAFSSATIDVSASAQPQSPIMETLAQERARPMERFAPPPRSETTGSSQVVTGSREDVFAARARAVAACVEAISPHDLRSIGKTTRPHPSVKEIVETSIMLLGYRDTKWSAAQAYFEDAEGLLQKMRSFDASRSVSRLQYQKLCRSLGSPGTTPSPFFDGVAQSVCPPVAGLTRWCRAVGELLEWRYGESPSSGSPPDAGSSYNTVVQLAPRRDDDMVSNETSRPARTPSLASSKNEGPCAEQRLQDNASSVNNVSSAPPSSKEKPSLDDLEVLPDVRMMSIAELRRVRDFTVRKPGVGEVLFHGEIDLVAQHRVLENLAAIVRLEPGEVVLYPDPGTKPAQGDGLNRPATITLFGCNPPSAGKFNDAESKARYRDRIASMTEAKGAKFVDYDCDRGVWQFSVEHF
eukprot:TRINITY_DN14303_c0_g1_i1.p1 TRINITY_DN14303_c0_g1~~TRINITY_DN14303_c0_g1_i1.p1  ORF type:complete len:783 (-),score=78.15 TRINITY_DN14303_c0_g1_i1:255-2510(-)